MNKSEAASNSVNNLLNQGVLGYRIYGDNIEECTKFGEMLVRVGDQMGLHLIHVYRRYSNPVYVLQCSNEVGGLEGQILAFHICGRFGEWSNNRKPFIGHEDSDIILTFVGAEGGAGRPILSIEFNDAIPAGNNAWQRFPRIAQAAEVGVSFIYSLPVCDAEVFDGKLRSLRHPNVAVPIGQLILMALYGVPSLAIYGESPWYTNALEVGLAHEEINGVNSEFNIGAFALSKALETGAKNLGAEYKIARSRQNKIKTKVITDTLNKMLSQISYFVGTDFSILENHQLLDTELREEVVNLWLNRIEENEEIPKEYRFYEWNPDNLKQKARRFSKATSTDSLFKDKLNPLLRVSSSARKKAILDFAKRWDIPTSEDLTKAKLLDLIENGQHRWKKPLSYKPPVNEIAFIFNVEVFADLLANIYPNLDPDFILRCRKAAPPLLFLPIAGYVEDSGGVIAFSRPDKGLVGLTNTLFGRSGVFTERMILMYHQEIPQGWREELEIAVAELRGEEIARRPNNLWRETAQLATMVIVDHLQEGWVA